MRTPGVQKPHCSALVRTKAALQLLDLARIRKPFDRVDRTAVGLCREHQAAAHDLAVDAHRAGAAHAVLTADMVPVSSSSFLRKSRVEPHRHRALDALAVHREHISMVSAGALIRRRPID